MKKLSHNQEMNIVSHIYDLLIANNPWYDDERKQADDLYHTIQELVSDMIDRI